jgi:hypothetical protein
MGPEEPKNPTQNKEEVGSILKPLRTYERDVADMIRAHQTSEIAINLAKKKKEESKPEIKVAQEKKKFVFVAPKDRVNHNKFYTVLSIIFIFIGVGILFTIYFIKLSTQEVKISTPAINTFIPSNEGIVFSINKLDQTQIAEKFSEILKEKKSDDVVTYIKITTQTGSTTVEADAETFFKTTFKNIPSSLTRSFDKKMFAGIYAKEKNNPFFIIQIDSFDRAFEGMLTWEKNIFNDMKPFLNISASENSNVESLPLSNLEDLIVQNKDTRVLKNDRGETLLLYSFIDSKTLFIVNNESTFKEILKRFNTSKTIR